MQSRSSMFKFVPLVGLLYGPAIAAEVSTTVLDTISITATRIEETTKDVPTAVGVVTQQDIQLGTQQLGLDESLVKIPGIFMQNRYNFAQDLRVSVRGFGARSSFGIRGVKILVDGIPETLPDGQGSVDGIDLGSTESIEVIRGPASALYGNASGGAIIINSERPPEVPFVELRPSFGSDGFEKQQLKFGASSAKLGYLVNLSSLDYDGYRDHAETEATQLNSKLFYEFTDRSKLRLSLNHSDSPMANDPGGITAEQMAADPTQARTRNVDFNSGEAMTQTRLGLIYDRQLDSGAELMARTYSLTRDFDNYLPFVGGGSVAFQRQVAGVGLQYSRSHQLGEFNNRFTLGLDYDKQSDDRQRYDNNQGVRGDVTLDQQENVSSTGLFLQNELDFSEKVQLTAGLRADKVTFDVSDYFLSNGDDSGERSFEEISPSLGLRYHADERVTVFGTISTAFETPTTTELANPDGGGFNADIESQKSTNFEIGAKNKISDYSRYEVSFFNINVEDELIPYELESQPDREFFKNAGESRRRGVELLVESELSKNLKGTLAYSYSDFTFRDFIDGDNDYSGKILPGVPEQLIHADLLYTHDSGFYANLSILHSDDIVANNANTAIADSYTVANAKLGWNKFYGNWEFSPFLGINNLNDESYASNVRINAYGSRYFEPAPEQNIYGGFGIRYDYN